MAVPEKLSIRKKLVSVNSLFLTTGNLISCNLLFVCFFKQNPPKTLRA